MIPKIVIVYHSPCNDGTCAAWVAYNWLKNCGEVVKVKFVPVNYGPTADRYDELLTLATDEHNELWILDFSYDEARLRELATKYGVVHVIDHHEKSVKALSGVVIEGVRFCLDIAHSGAMLTWMVLHNETAQRAQPAPPWQVRYVQDYDLWRKSLVGCDDVAAYFGEMEGRDYDESFVGWDKAVLSLAQEYGGILMRSRKLMMDHHVTKVRSGKWSGLDVRYVVCSVPQLISNLGNRVAVETGCDFVIVEGADGCSLRCVKDTVNVNEICQKYGGGGHPKAAGCTKDILKDITWVS